METDRVVTMMLGDIPLKDLTAPTIVALVVLMVLLRWLVPRATYKEKCQESENWRLAYEAEREARTRSDAQTTELLELAKTSHNVLVAAFGTTGLIRRTGGDQWDSSGIGSIVSAQKQKPKRPGLLSRKLDEIF